MKEHLRGGREGASDGEDALEGAVEGRSGGVHWIHAGSDRD